MALADVLTSLAGSLPVPTPEDVEIAKAEIGPALSKSPAVADVQAKAWAYQYVLRRESARQPQAKPADIERDILAEVIAHDVAASTALVPGTIYAGISLHAPTVRDTDVVRFLRDGFFPAMTPHALILGGVGAGKTFGAIGFVASQMAFSQTAAGKSWDGLFVTARSLSELLGAGNEKHERLDKLRRIKWLIIDDLKTGGEGAVTNALVSLIEDLFADRHMRRRHTLVTSNATIAQIAETYGDRFISRFRGDGVVFQSNQTDMRGLK